jgi:hypothetical protein
MMDTNNSQAVRHIGENWIVDYLTGLIAEKRKSPDSVGLLAELVRVADADGVALTDRS